MTCNNCNIKSKVLNTRNRASNQSRKWKDIPKPLQSIGIVYRERECLSCGELFDTIEVRVNEALRWQKSTL